MDKLKEFYNDTAMKEEVKAFMVSQLKDMAVERVFEDKPIVGLYETNELIDKMFLTLDQKYGIIKQPNVESSR